MKIAAIIILGIGLMTISGLHRDLDEPARGYGEKRPMNGRIIRIEPINQLSDGELELLREAEYLEDTKLAIYWIGTESSARKYIAPFDQTLKAGDIVEDYGTWAIGGQVASPSGQGDLELHIVEMIRARRAMATE